MKPPYFLRGSPSGGFAPDIDFFCRDVVSDVMGCERPDYWVSIVRFPLNALFGAEAILFNDRNATRQRIQFGTSERKKRVNENSEVV